MRLILAATLLGAGASRLQSSEKAGSWLNGDATIFKIPLKYFWGPDDIN